MGQLIALTSRLNMDMLRFASMIVMQFPPRLSLKIAVSSEFLLVIKFFRRLIILFFHQVKLFKKYILTPVGNVFGIILTKRHNHLLQVMQTEVDIFSFRQNCTGNGALVYTFRSGERIPRINSLQSRGNLSR